MRTFHSTIFTLAWMTHSACLFAAGDEPAARPSFDYEAARTHEIKPHRRTVPLEGANGGFNQLHLTLTVSATGDVVDADAGGDEKTLQFWPELRDEVLGWKFVPFERDGNAVTAEVEEYIDLVPPERLPKVHVAAPRIKRNSKISIALQRTGCFGSCPSYTVTVSTEGIVFDGGGYTVASGKHRDKVDAREVRELAKEFVAADFYSMDDQYQASVTDNPFYNLTISIGGRTKAVDDYVGEWVGMPAVISELEGKVDELARTGRWIRGDSGLVEALQAEKFNFRSYDAQVSLKEAASRGKSETVRQLLEAGVPLEPFPAPKPKEEWMAVPFEHVGWLRAASESSESLGILIDAKASEEDQDDKDLALASAVEAGNLEGARALIAYGANPNADLSKLVVTGNGAGMTMEGPGNGSILISAAISGNPEMVREILKYLPDLEARDGEGKTAVFGAGESRRYRDKDGARAECLRLLAQAGAIVDARDDSGNTPLHKTYLTGVEEELIKLGADVNARNEDGETPIFTTVDDEEIPLLIAHGADLTIRNNSGDTVLEAAIKSKGPQRVAVLRKAIEEMGAR